MTTFQLRRADLFAAIAVALTAIFLTQREITIIPLRAIIAVFLVLVLPGHTLIASVFPNRNFAIGERIWLTLAASLTLTALGGLVLHATAGLRDKTWAIYLGSLVIILSLIAFFRERNASATTPNPRTTTRLSLVDSLLLTTALLITLGALVIANIPTAINPTQTYTSLWITPNQTDTNNLTVQLGLRSQEAEKKAYRLQLKSAGYIFHHISSVELEPGAEWSSEPIAMPNNLGEQNAIEVELFRLDTPEKVYRSVAFYPNSIKLLKTPETQK
jgi:uncharacterized membrane protein